MAKGGWRTIRQFSQSNSVLRTTASSCRPSQLLTGIPQQNDATTTTTLRTQYEGQMHRDVVQNLDVRNGSCNTTGTHLAAGTGGHVGGGRFATISENNGTVQDRLLHRVGICFFHSKV
jgi:hypothetical protein